MGRSQWSQSACRRKTSATTVRASEQLGLGSRTLACLSNLPSLNWKLESFTVRLFQTQPLRWDWSFSANSGTAPASRLARFAQSVLTSVSPLPSRRSWALSRDVTVKTDGAFSILFALEQRFDWFAA